MSPENSVISLSLLVEAKLSNLSIFSFLILKKSIETGQNWRPNYFTYCACAKANLRRAMTYPFIPHAKNNQYIFQYK